MSSENVPHIQPRSGASGRPPVRVFLRRSPKAEVSSLPPSWLARKMGLHLYSNVLLTQKVRTEMNFAAGLLLLVSLFEWLLWTLLFNGIYSSNIYNLDVTTILAALTALFFGFAVFWFERQMLTSSEKGRRFWAALGLRLVYITVAAVITSQTFELMLFQKPILERAREEAIRGAAAKHYLEVLDAEAAAGQASTLVQLTATFEEKQLAAVRAERQKEERQRNYLQTQLAAARTEGDAVKASKFDGLLAESKDRLDRLLENERRAEEALRDRLREIELARTRIVQNAGDRRGLFQQWVTKIRASKPGDPVNDIRGWEYQDPKPRFFEQLFLLADLREGRPAAWPGATPEIRADRRNKFGFYEPPTCPDPTSSPRLGTASYSLRESQLLDIALDCERRLSNTQIYNRAWWAGLFTAMLIPTLILIIKVTLLPEELRFYYSRSYQAELGDVEARNIDQADERLRNAAKTHRERSGSVMFGHGTSGSEPVLLNGISGVDGSYPFPRTTVADLAALARGARLERNVLEKLQRWLRDKLGLFRDVRDDFSQRCLEDAGWGVIFPRESDSKIRKALRPLHDCRKVTAAARADGRFREMWGEEGYAKGESMRDFLLRHGAEFGATDPRQMPYYLLLVGGPHETSFSFQYDLDVRHAVGRLDFDTPEEYAAYAESVVAAEKAWSSTPSPMRSLALFCPPNPDGVSVRLKDELVAGLKNRFSSVPMPGCSVRSIADDGATRESLCDLLGGNGTPDVLFTACHGLVFPPDHALQREKQGALYCLNRTGATPLDSSVSAAEVSNQARLHGLISFHYACHSAGTPELELNDFSSRARAREANRPFTTRLPQRILGHPNGGALAAIGHVSRAWTYSFSGFGNAPHLNTFEDVLHRLLRGETVGRALELFNFRHAEMAAELLNLQELEELEPAAGERDVELATLYCAAKDARNYVVLGDPAVRLQPVPVSSKNTTEGQADGQI